MKEGRSSASWKTAKPTETPPSPWRRRLAVSCRCLRPRRLQQEQRELEDGQADASASRGHQHRPAAATAHPPPPVTKSYAEGSPEDHKPNLLSLHRPAYFSRHDGLVQTITAVSRALIVFVSQDPMAKVSD